MLTLKKTPQSSIEFVNDLSSTEGWEHYDEKTENFVRDCPKVELHVHLDGSFEFDLFWETIQRKPSLIKTCFPEKVNHPWEPSITIYSRKLVEDCRNSLDYRKLCVCKGKRSLKAMLDCFEMFLPVVRGNLELLEELSYDFVRRQKEQNIVYTEVRYSPQLLCGEYKVSVEAIMESVTKGLRRGCEDYGVIVNQILCAMSLFPQWSSEVVKLAEKHRNDYPCAVVGIDIAAGEQHFDIEESPEFFKPHIEMVEEAKKLGINVTIHAGETTRAQNVADAISEKKYNAKRIGHAYRMIDSQDIMDEVIKKNVHIEICPTSSLETGGWLADDNGVLNWNEHPVLIMKEKGVSLSFSSDDPAVFDTSLSWQYRIALARMGFNKKEVLKTIMDSMNAAFCKEEQKIKCKKTIEEFSSLYISAKP